MRGEDDYSRTQALPLAIERKLRKSVWKQDKRIKREANILCKISEIVAVAPT